ncbi:MAG: MFS transporter [Alphaproteobacteria bacterium]|nr:MFS transporter [Alphaproteobacteria bacterium]
MSLESAAGRSPAQGRLSQLGWALYQFAASPYFVIINIFVFAAYFQKHVVGDNVEGQVVWGYTQAAAGMLIALCSPILGALADAYGPRKPGLLLFSAIAIPAMLALWFVTEGNLWLGILAIIVAAVTMEFAAVYHNAMLTSIAGEKNVGFLSGLAYSLDYVGSVTLFIVWLTIPTLGILALFSGEFAHERLSGPLSALWLIVFSIPLVLFTHDRPRTGLSIVGAIGSGLQQLGRTISQVSHYRNIGKYLLVRAIYADGMSAVFTFLAGYLSGVFGWGTAKIGLFALIVLTVPIFTSFIGGWIDDKVGSRRTIQVGLLMFTLAVAGSVSTTPNEYLFFFPVTEELRAQQLPVLGPLLAMFGFTQFPEQLSLAFSILGGVFVGPILASSRTMVARIAPQTMISEVYGLFTLTGKATAFAAPFLVAVVTSATQSQRAGFAVILVFLVLGFVGLWWVKEERAEVAPPR